MITIERESFNDYGQPVRREWLVTNGIGGYAMGTLTGGRTRRYHGLLVAALQPPVGRWLMATSLNETFALGGKKYHLSGRSTHARAYVSRGGMDFRLEGTTPVWSYNSREFHLQKRVFMAHGANTTYVRYTLLRADAPIVLYGTVNAAYRDHHAALCRAPEHYTISDAGSAPPESHRPQAEPLAGGLRIRVTPDAVPLTLAGDDAAWTPVYRWNFGEYLSIEHERGFDHHEDTLAVAEYTARICAGESLTVLFSAEDAPDTDGEAAYHAHREREKSLLKGAHTKKDTPPEIKQLIHAADQFIVRRALDTGETGFSVIAGYPWFGDWGRDTMIALPGLTLATRRFDIARGILTTFARYIDRGMLPNRFPDSGEAPEYNTADATLWYFEAVRAYVAATGDRKTLAALYPALAGIVRHHIDGTRYGIGVDAADGLLRAGEPGQNLTWMDAKVEGVVITPRHGKPVEICALWINALAAMRGFAALLRQPDEYAQPLEQASASFACFWDEKRGYLKDVIDADDSTLRPNQLIAAMLPTVPLTTAQRRSIVDVCGEKLYTPYGIRTLAPDDPNYRGVFTGDWRTRDSMYHQGAAWSWLLGPFISAHFRAYGDREAAYGLLKTALAQLSGGCVGSVSELFDGDAPHHPRAACAQAWGVAELLRVWHALSEGAAQK